jgi:hypothetical protein
MNGNHLIRSGGASGGPVIIGDSGGEDPFEIAFRPAKPVLDAIVEMWKPLAWLDRQRQSRLPLFDSKRAGELINVIPNDSRLLRAGALFQEAEQEPAPEGWVHIAIGLMLASMGPAAANVHDAYRCGIVDGKFQDPENWEGYSPGFSTAVVARSIREVRRQDGVPSPARFLAMCAKHRARFKQWNADMNTLTAIRYEAEDTLDEIGYERLDDYDEEDLIPF